MKRLLTEELIIKYCEELTKYVDFYLNDQVEYILKDFLAKIREVVLSKEMLEIGRKAIEDVLIDWRDNRLSEFNRGNGLVIREKDGSDSDIIRFGPETALKIGCQAILKAIKGE